MMASHRENEMRLEVGKTYRARNGDIHGPIRVDPDYPDRFTDKYGNWYGADGHYWQQGPNCPFSLVECVENPLTRGTDMLYDPKWEQKTGTKPSLQGFIAWLEQQPPDEAYEYWTCHECAIGQYLQSIGTTYTDQCRTGVIRLLCDWNNQITRKYPRTLGAALDRARLYAQ